MLVTDTRPGEDIPPDALHYEGHLRSGLGRAPVPFGRRVDAPHAARKTSNEPIKATKEAFEAQYTGGRVAIKLIWMMTPRPRAVWIRRRSVRSRCKSTCGTRVWCRCWTRSCTAARHQYLGVVMSLEKEDVNAVLAQWMAERKEVGREEDVRRWLRLVRERGCGVAYMGANGFGTST